MLRRIAATVALILSGSIDPSYAQQRYPSLSRRPVESRNRAAEIVKAEAPIPVPPLDAGTVADLERLRLRAATGSRAFDAAYGASGRSVSAASGAPVGSEAWVVAQEALSALDQGRFDSVAALASMDAIYIDQYEKGGDVAAVDTLRTPVLAIVDRQNDRLDGLRARLARP